MKVGALGRGKLRGADHKEQGMDGGKQEKGEFSRARKGLWRNSGSRVLPELSRRQEEEVRIPYN